MPTETVGDNTSSPGPHTYTGGTGNWIVQDDDTNHSPDFIGVKLGTGGNEERALYLFTKPGGLGTITVSAATLFVYQKAGDFTADTFTATRIVRAGIVLGEGAGGCKWTTYDASATWGTAGCSNTTSDIAASSSDTSPGLAAAGFIQFTSATIAADIQAAFNSAAAYVAWRITSNNQFSTNDLTSQTGTNGTRPYISFTYTAAGGGVTQRILVAGQGVKRSSIF